MLYLNSLLYFDENLKSEKLIKNFTKLEYLRNFTLVSLWVVVIFVTLLL